MFALFRIQGSAKDDSVPHSKALHGNERFHAKLHVTPLVTLTWIMQCMLLNEPIPSPGQLREIMRTDLYHVVFLCEGCLIPPSLPALALNTGPGGQDAFHRRSLQDTLHVFYLMHNRF